MTMTQTKSTPSSQQRLLPPLVDIGINLTHKQFDRDREEVVQRGLEQANVHALVVTGCSVRGSIEAQTYCATTNNASSSSSNKNSNTGGTAAAAAVHLFSTAGVHPHDAKSCNDSETIPTLRRLASTTQVVAIGECGLDYNRNFSPPDVQRKWFKHQLELACEVRLPVFLHERDAHHDFFQILQRYCHKLPAAVIHCFTGTKEELETYLTVPNFYIGITGWVCDERRGLELRKIVPLIPDDRLMIETDAPFLYPRDLPAHRRRLSSNNHNKKKDRRHNRNEPAYLDHVCESVAACRRQTPEHVAKITTANAARFFQLPASLLEQD
mmetsp:Transcript_14197/g.34212  ORF Transcript_14197/g.34212 Transcript_14197/m.34212 type:complete len:325 (+) Transcript_14197:128-1102(+)